MYEFDSRLGSIYVPDAALLYSAVAWSQSFIVIVTPFLRRSAYQSALRLVIVGALDCPFLCRRQRSTTGRCQPAEQSTGNPRAGSEVARRRRSGRDPALRRDALRHQPVPVLVDCRC